MLGTVGPSIPSRRPGKALSQGPGDAFLGQSATRVLQAGGDVPVGGTRGEGLEHGAGLPRGACLGEGVGLQLDLPSP